MDQRVAINISKDRVREQTTRLKVVPGNPGTYPLVIGILILTPRSSLEKRIFYRGTDGGIYHVWWLPGVSVSPTDPLPSDKWVGPGVSSDRSAQVAAGDPVTMVPG